MNPRVIKIMKISIPTTICILALSACAGGSYADDSVTDGTGAKKTNTSTTETSTDATDNSGNNTPASTPAFKVSFANTISKEKEAFNKLDNEKLVAQQTYNSSVNQPITVTKHGQVISDKIIFAGKNDNCGITINGYQNVKIKNVTIYHANTGVCANTAKDLNIDSLKLVSLAAPATGPHCPRTANDGLATDECWGGERGKPADSRLGLSLKNSANASINNLATFQASSGVYAINSPHTHISKIRCYDMRGPFPRGQCVQFNNSNYSSVTTFYAKNYYNQSHSEDNFNAYKSSNVSIKNGLIDGNWSTHGMGIIADKGSDNMLIDDIDFLNISTSAVNVWSNDVSKIGKNFTASKLRIKNSQCYSRKKGAPSTGGLIIAAQPAAVNPNFSNIQWFNHCRPSTNWCLPGQGCRKNDTGSLLNFREQNFTTRWTAE